MSLTLNIKPFSFKLKRELRTSQGSFNHKTGWLLQLKNSSGDLGWGEISPINSSLLKPCKNLLEALDKRPSREELEEGINNWPGAMAFGIGSALAELDGLIGVHSQEGWLNSPASTILLDTNQSILTRYNK